MGLTVSIVIILRDFVTGVILHCIVECLNHAYVSISFGIGINGLFLPVYLNNYSPRISEAQAQEIFLKHLGQEPSAPIEIELGVFNPEAYDSPENPALVWRVTIEQFPNPVYFIDAEDGSVIHHFNHVETALDTQIWKHNDSGGDCPGDADVYVFGTDPPYFVGTWLGTSQFVFEGTQCTYQYYLDRHGMDSWDGNGATMYACSDYGENPTVTAGGNYGGLGPSFGGCGACPDIIGHEFTHKYMRSLTLLIGNIQSNSLRESFCDVMGEFIEDHCFGPPDWFLGTGGSRNTGPCAHVVPDRSLKDPPEKGHPDHWNDFDWEADIDGHVNCGISNKSAWLLGREPSEGWTAHAGVGVRGIGTHDAGDIWFGVMANWITSNAQFSEFGEAIQNAAWSLYGLSDQHTQSRRSTMAVGLWSTDSNQYFDTDSSASLISGFTVNGEWRKYVFYKETDNGSSPPRLCYRYRNSALYGHEPWSDEYYLALADTSQAPSAVVFEDRIWVFFMNGDDPVLRCITIDDQNKLEEFYPNGSTPSTDQSPSALVFNDKIYVFCKSPGNDASGIQYFRYDGHWSGPHDTGFSSTDGPRAAAPLNDKLWLFWRDGGDDSIRYSAMDADENWDAGFTVPNNAKTQDTPAVAIHRNRLHLAASGPDNGIYYTSCSLPCTQAGDWTRFVKQDHGLGRRMTLFSDIDSWLYLFHRFQTADTVAWRKKFSE